MYWVVDGYLNTIVTEGLGIFLNGACELDYIEQKNSKQICKKHTIQLIERFGWKLCPLNLDKIIFHQFSYHIILSEQEQQQYIKYYYKKWMLWSCTQTALQRWTWLNILVLNWVSSCWYWGEKFTIHPEQGWSMWGGELPLSFPIYRQMCEIVKLFFNHKHFFRDLISMEWYMIAKTNSCVQSHVKHLDCIDDFC